MRSVAWTVCLSTFSLLTGCGRDSAAPPPPPSPPAPPAYVVSEHGGTVATGPGERRNNCERVWCSVHGENFFVTHYLERHSGWILHTDDMGDVFSPARGPQRQGYPQAKRTALRLCGQHLHPWMLGRGGGAIRHTGYNRSLGYGRSHWSSFGTRLEPCCPNGLGWGWLHASSGRQFRLHDVAVFRANPDIGWSKPVQARR